MHVQTTMMEKLSETTIITTQEDYLNEVRQGFVTWETIYRSSRAIQECMEVL
jgi:hypothetical protein